MEISTKIISTVTASVMKNVEALRVKVHDPNSNQ